MMMQMILLVEDHPRLLLLLLLLLLLYILRKTAPALSLLLALLHRVWHKNTKHAKDEEHHARSAESDRTKSSRQDA